MIKLNCTVHRQGPIHVGIFREKSRHNIKDEILSNQVMIFSLFSYSIIKLGQI